MTSTYCCRGSGDVESFNRPLEPGIFAPVPSFFLPDSEDLDITSFQAHVVQIATAGIGPLIAGSMGEAIHLSHTERTTLIKAARTSLDDAGLSHVPLIVGTGAGSTRETIVLSMDAAEAGADYAIVIASGYYAGAWANDRMALKNFFMEVSEKSPIPVIIYNYPAASSGIDLDSDIITELAKECPNIFGVKLTCANIGKLTRIADIVHGSKFSTSHPRKNAGAKFLVLGGFIDFLVPSAFANAHGAITGLANFVPLAVMKLFELSEAAKRDLSIVPEAQRIQGILARADYTISKASIAGIKFLLQKTYGYGGPPRKPLPPIGADVAQALWEHPHTQDALRLEQELSSKTKSQR